MKGERVTVIAGMAMGHPAGPRRVQRVCGDLHLVVIYMRAASHSVFLTTHTAAGVVVRGVHWVLGRERDIHTVIWTYDM